MKKGRVTPNPDSRQTRQNIDFFNSIRTKRTFAAVARKAVLAWAYGN